MCYTMCSCFFICADKGPNIHNFHFKFFSLTMSFFCKPKLVVKYSSTSYTKIVAIDDSIILTFEFDKLIANYLIIYSTKLFLCRSHLPGGLRRRIAPARL